MSKPDGQKMKTGKVRTTSMMVMFSSSEIYLCNEMAGEKRRRYKTHHIVLFVFNFMPLERSAVGVRPVATIADASVRGKARCDG